MKKILLLSLTIMLVACKKEATIKLPAPVSKLVVTCFISPENSQITAAVKSSVPKYNTPGQSGYGDDITDATVILSDGVNSITLPYFSGPNFYMAESAQFPVIAGKTYTLTVTTPNGEKTTAATTVPASNLSIQNADVVIRNEQSNGGNFPSFDYDLSIVVNDIPNETNYVEFMFESATVKKHKVYDPADPQAPPATVTDTLYTPLNYSVFFDTDEVLAKNSYKYTLSEGFYSYYDTDSLVAALVNVNVINCSKEFYLYNQSVTKAYESGDNPFGEPVLIYTNMSNGYGCFGAYRNNRTLKKVK